MKVKFKKYIIILLLISVFNFIPTNVKAISFDTLSCQTRVYNDRNLNYTTDNRTGYGYNNCVKYESGTNNYAFCANEGEAYTGSGVYTGKDYGYSSANTCKFTHNGITYTNGDCSRIIGYIIKHALKDPVGETDTIGKEWLRAQASIWIYLANFVPQNKSEAGFDVTNSPSYGRPKTAQTIWADTINPSKSASEKNKFVKKIFEDAWKEYYENHYQYDSGQKPLVTNVDYITVTAESKEFYYIPNYTSSGNVTCNMKGTYRTKDITIKNNTTDEINVNINTNSSGGLKICTQSNGCVLGNRNIKILGEASIKIYLASDGYLQDINSITFEATPPTMTTTSTEKYYDSVRWDTESGYQSIILLEIEEKTEEPTPELEPQIETINFNQKRMQHKTCPDGTRQTENSLGTSNNPAGEKNNLVCAGRDKSNEIYKLDNNTIGEGLKYCTCTTINLGNGDYVNVTLTQNMAFKYGYVTPTTVYSGGGFELSNTGITTDYLNVIVWDYADWLGDEPYYYKKGEEYSNRNARLRKEDIEKEIKKKILEKLNQSEIIFDTYDSNKVKDGEGETVEYSIPLNQNVTYEYDSETQKFKIKIEKISLKEAYFNGTGVVGYEKNDDYYINGGKKYYVPLYYQKDIDNLFKFDISSNTNLSLVDGIDYHISAKCNVSVVYSIPEIRYRPITVKEPFPQGAASIPENWVEWWKSTSFQTRIKNTFQNLDYKLEITKEKENKILEINKKNSYTNWNYIKNNGSSNFINGTNDINLGFETKPNIASSYCPLGESDYMLNGKTTLCKK